jgi:hypothetical protein
MASANEAELRELREKLDEATRALESSKRARKDADAEAREVLRSREEEYRRKEAALVAEHEEGNRQAAKVRPYGASAPALTLLWRSAFLTTSLSRCL